MAKMITVKPKKELILVKGVHDECPRFLKLKEDESVYMTIPRETFTEKGFSPNLDIRLIQVNHVDAIENYMLYIGELIGIARNSGDVPNVLIDVLTDMFFKLKSKKEMLINE